MSCKLKNTFWYSQKITCQNYKGCQLTINISSDFVTWKKWLHRKLNFDFFFLCTLGHQGLPTVAHQPTGRDGASCLPWGGEARDPQSEGCQWPGHIVATVQSVQGSLSNWLLTHVNEFQVLFYHLQAFWLEMILAVIYD